jgi:phosphonate transport system substrate-binding protein
MHRHPVARSRPLLSLVVIALLVALVGCGGDDGADAASGTAGAGGVLRIGAIPDQDPEKLARSFGLVADHFAETLGVDVEYVPVTDYAAAVSLFRTGDLDLVWFGGLTGVQARLETPGAEVVAQRDIDEEFRSVFVANTGAGLDPIGSVDDLAVLDGRRFTFGSESSTSGRLMPQYFLDRAGVGPDDFAGEPGFSGSHDRTIALVASGTYEAGVLNEQVWTTRVEDGSVDATKVVPIFLTPTYHDYHWLLHPSTAERFGDGFGRDVRDALTSLTTDDPDDKEILSLFGAGSFIPGNADDYTEIEQIGRELGLVTE